MGEKHGMMLAGTAFPWGGSDVACKRKQQQTNTEFVALQLALRWCHKVWLTGPLKSPATGRSQQQQRCWKREISLARGKRVDKPHTQIRKLEACCSFVLKKKNVFLNGSKGRKSLKWHIKNLPTGILIFMYLFLFIYLFIFLAVTVQVMGSVYRMFGWIIRWEWRRSHWG